MTENRSAHSAVMPASEHGKRRVAAVTTPEHMILQSTRFSKGINVFIAPTRSTTTCVSREIAVRHSSATRFVHCPINFPRAPSHYIDKLTGIQSLETCIAPLAALVSFATWRSSRLPFLRDLDFPFVSSSDPSQSNCNRGHLRGSPGVGKAVSLKGRRGDGGKKA